MTTPTESSDRVARNLWLMKEGDSAFNRHDEAYFVAAHHPDMVAHVMGSLEPVVGRDALGAALDAMVRAFPDMHVHNDPYPVQFGAGDWTTVIGRVGLRPRVRRPDRERRPPQGTGQPQPLRALGGRLGNW